VPCCLGTGIYGVLKRKQSFQNLSTLKEKSDTKPNENRSYSFLLNSIVKNRLGRVYLSINFNLFWHQIVHPTNKIIKLKFLI
jgi:hypothetical protein